MTENWNNHWYDGGNTCRDCGAGILDPDRCPGPDQTTLPDRQTPVTASLIALLREREAIGIERYGRTLTTNNGRDALQDALEEALDLSQYLQQAKLERDAVEVTVKRVQYAEEAAARAGIVGWNPEWSVGELVRLYADRASAWNDVGMLKSVNSDLVAALNEVDQELYTAQERIKSQERYAAERLTSDLSMRPNPDQGPIND